MEVKGVGRILLFLLLYVAVLVGPWVAALCLKPVPLDAPFPTRREWIAFLVALCLLPAASYLTVAAMSAYLFFAGPILMVSCCVFVTAIAGRHPFICTVALALLHLVGFLLWLSKMTGTPYDFTSRTAGVQSLLILVAIALVCGGIGGLFLFGLWRGDEKAEG